LDVHWVSLPALSKAVVGRDPPRGAQGMRKYVYCPSSPLLLSSLLLLPIRMRVVKLQKPRGAVEAAEGLKKVERAEEE
jgi:hypothetical protein